MSDEPYIADKAIALTERLIELNVTPDKAAEVAFHYAELVYQLKPKPTRDAAKPIDLELDRLPDDLWDTLASAEGLIEIEQVLSTHPQIAKSDVGRFAKRIFELLS
jgi:hypothetical protein